MVICNEDSIDKEGSMYSGYMESRAPAKARNNSRTGHIWAYLSTVVTYKFVPGPVFQTIGAAKVCKWESHYEFEVLDSLSVRISTVHSKTLEWRMKQNNVQSCAQLG